MAIGVSPVDIITIPIMGVIAVQCAIVFTRLDKLNTLQVLMIVSSPTIYIGLGGC